MDDDDNEEVDPRLVGEFLVAAHTTGTQMCALLTALSSGMIDVADEILNEVLAEGAQATKNLVGNLAGSFVGLILAFCAMTGVDPEQFLAGLAYNNSMMLEVGNEIVRMTDPSAQGGEEHPS